MNDPNMYICMLIYERMHIYGKYMYIFMGTCAYIDIYLYVHKLTTVDDTLNF